MARRHGTSRKSYQKGSTVKDHIPDVYQEMLAEAIPLQLNSPPKPLKRRKIENKANDKLLDSTDIKQKEIQKNLKRDKNENDDEENQFIDQEKYQNKNRSENNVNKKFFLPSQDSRESSVDPQCVRSCISPVLQQTAFRDVDEDSEESGCEWESVDFHLQNESVADSIAWDPGAKDLELTLTKTLAPQDKRSASRKKVITKADRAVRLAVHKVHILCLLSYLDSRNDWCNDPQVQTSLKPMLTPNMLKLLRPRSELSQFGRTNSLKRGLEEISILWRSRFCITERGMRRALWAENDNYLHEVSILFKIETRYSQPFQPKIPEDMDSVVDKVGFRKAAAATKLKGSRDIGAQLFCALLRSAGVQTRLVCSLQPLSFTAVGPSRACEPSIHTREEIMDKTVDLTDKSESSALDYNKTDFDATKKASILQQRCRLGHPNAADYRIPIIKNPLPQPSRKIIRKNTLRESPYPIFWVEVFNEAHQNWIPVDPLVTHIIAKNRGFEPPASDKENNMSYVISFDNEGYARDVTRRYVKAYNSKTRKIRVESTTGGEKWWVKVLRSFSRVWHTDADQIEDTELANLEAREQMPKCIADFKNHSYFVLERHLRRNEVLVNAQECGRVAIGREIGLGNNKKMESVYRRKDIHVGKSADAWYRLGREVKPGEQPVKIVQSKRKPQVGDIEIAKACTTVCLFTEKQTEPYQAPPIVNGRVPKNSYGNIEIFVPSMIPRGGIHLPNAFSTQAAQIIGIDYANALTGFKFSGRHGMVILEGVVIAKEYEDAVRAVIEGLEDDKFETEEKIRTKMALRMWKRFMIALRIKKRIDSYVIEGEDSKPCKIQDLNDKPSDGSCIDVDIHSIDRNSDRNSSYDSDSNDEYDSYGGGFVPE